MRVNLLEKDESRKIEWLEIVIVLLIILVFTIPIVTYYLNYVELNHLKQQKQNWNNRLLSLNPQQEVYYDLKEKVSNFKLPPKVELEKYTISPFLTEFSRLINNNISFNTLNYNGGQVIINGRADSIKSLLNFSGRIYKSDVFSVISLEQFENNEELQFSLTVQLDSRQRGEIYNE